MKKQYIIPDIDVANIGPIQFFAGSGSDERTIEEVTDPEDPGYYIDDEDDIG